RGSRGGPPGILFLCRRSLLAPGAPFPFSGRGWSIPFFFEVRRCHARIVSEPREPGEVSGLAKALSCSHLRSCDSRATCHFDHWGSIPENRWKTAIPGAGQFQAMSFAASFRRKSGLCSREACTLASCSDRTRTVAVDKEEIRKPVL